MQHEIVHAQVAEALASRGAVRASVSLLAALAQDALLEGWLSLAAGLLFRLLEVSRPLAAVRLHPTVPLPCTASALAKNLVLWYRQVQDVRQRPDPVWSRVCDVLRLCEGDMSWPATISTDKK